MTQDQFFTKSLLFHFSLKNINRKLGQTCSQWSDRSLRMYSEGTRYHSSIHSHPACLGVLYLRNPEEPPHARAHTGKRQVPGPGTDPAALEQEAELWPTHWAAFCCLRSTSISLLLFRGGQQALSLTPLQVDQPGLRGTSLPLELWFGVHAAPCQNFVQCSV